MRPFLYPILDAGTLAGRPLEPVVRALAEGGAQLLQVRAKGLPDAAFFELARAALAAARAAGVPLLVNDRPDVARILDADGVHLGQDDLPPAAARRTLGPAAIVGISTHSVAQVREAVGEPVDYVAVGPVYPTRTKRQAEPVVGLELVRAARAIVGVPLVAIGGITRGNARAVVDDLVAASREMCAALGGGR